MSAPINLVETLSLEPIEENLYRGRSPADRGPRIFGGLVVAQALLAAYHTVEDRLCHSLHCYFIRPGDPSIPILFQVDRARDGQTFTTRRVVAIQHGKQIFNMGLSFQMEISGLEHQEPLPDLPPPEVVTPDPDPDHWEREIEMRWLSPRHDDHPVAGPATQNVWVRARGVLPDEIAMQQAVLAYASDMSLLSTAMRPHALNWRTPNLQTASLDHAIWFHRPSNFNDWHLYAQRSPSASGGRGFNLGEIYNADGRLIASTAQEGLMRLRDPAS
jgi:acyl-CoA thioesterase-2